MLDFKKQDKALYPTTTGSSIVDVPAMLFLMVDGMGDPNTSAAYAAAIETLYGLSYGIKMGNKHVLECVVPPLEGFWCMGSAGIANKDEFAWTAVIRQPDFVTSEVLQAAQVSLLKRKKNLEVTSARLEQLTEGLCVQALHIGSYDDELATIAAMEQFAAQHGYEFDLDEARRHHEIYLSDPRKTAAEKLKTIIRQPIKPQLAIGVKIGA